MSAWRHNAGRSRLRECTTVTVQSACSSRAAMGLPTMFERPTTTACLPRSSPQASRSRRMQPLGVHGVSTSRPWARPPTFSLWKPSTSFSGLIAWRMRCSSIWAGNGSCTRMPLTSGARLRRPIRASSSAWLVSAGRRCSSERMPTSSARSTLLRTYTWLAASAPTSTTARPGCTPPWRSFCTCSRTSASTRVAVALPSISLTLGMAFI